MTSLPTPLTTPASAAATPGRALLHRQSSTASTASPELLAELAAHSQRLERATPQEIIAWAVQEYFPQLTMATAFGPEGCCILHMLAEVEPRTHVFNLDTGYQFPETSTLRDRIAQRYGIEVELKQPETTVEEYEAAAWRAAVSHQSRPMLLRPQNRRVTSERSLACGPG